VIGAGGVERCMIEKSRVGNKKGGKAHQDHRGGALIKDCTTHIKV